MTILELPVTFSLVVCLPVQRFILCLILFLSLFSTSLYVLYVAVSPLCVLSSVSKLIWLDIHLAERIYSTTKREAIKTKRPLKGTVHCLSFDSLLHHLISPSASVTILSYMGSVIVLIAPCGKCIPSLMHCESSFICQQPLAAKLLLHKPEPFSANQQTCTVGHDMEW